MAPMMPSDSGDGRDGPEACETDGGAEVQGRSSRARRALGGDGEEGGDIDAGAFKDIRAPEMERGRRRF